jgi:succinylglutamate desuccinylase
MKRSDPGHLGLLEVFPRQNLVRDECELLLRGGIHDYEREGSRYLHRFVERPKEKGK